ncbi:hypothetical protein M3G47_06180 [Corynebacterium sanguinis]|uniref:Uncharacterized protein n=2 Tax=Corynebacterium sanguinis TaxID=2594913 RepID=A0A6C1U0Y2_9CORY|nr:MULTISPECIES: hypothetical protein [Corynebacterium]MBA4505058.1 hypothetical protein [Corynebacterium sanguinis]MCT1411377.1 hypothetical protein [Corynebacterium sanguinis]MCT1426304.1 hypothetical protein [Corynebacterium sanguinis]MCT1444143.1 hypothetical protein [Corynebacterium sanguinis]MCT1464150.1 hypothetical protein [Corynebacterium sanguinis]
MESNDVKEALQAVEEVERSVERRSGQRRVPLWVGFAVSLLLGASMGLVVYGSLWGYALFVAWAVLLIAIAYTDSRNRGVRPTLKQEVKPEPQVSRSALVGPFLFFALILLPKGSVTWAIVAGVVSTAAFSVLYWWEWSGRAA